MSEKAVLITQSNYIPWKGYFDMIRAADEFVIYDDMQYTKRDWRNRNKVKTPQGPLWLSVPVIVKGKFDQKISDTEIDGKDWSEQHWRTITQNYSKTAYFKTYAPMFEEVYRQRTFQYLSELNFALLALVCNILDIKTTMRWSRDFTLAEDRTERLANICKELGGTRYITGPAAKAYMDEAVFTNLGITVQYADFSGYAPYRQMYGDFVHEVSVIDLIFNEGGNARSFMKKVV